MELAVAADVGMAVSQTVAETSRASATLAEQTTLQMLALGDTGQRIPLVFPL
jgi:hypothetical protein